MNDDANEVLNVIVIIGNVIVIIGVVLILYMFFSYNQISKINENLHEIKIHMEK